MKRRIIPSILPLFIVLLLFFFIPLHSAEKNSPLQEGSVKEQIDYVLRKSTTYDDFKVVKISNFYTLKKNILDTLKVKNNQILSANLIASAKTSNYDSLSQIYEKTSNELLLVSKDKNTIQFLGIKISKSIYNSIVWLIIGILAFSTILSYLLFKRSNRVTVIARKDLEELSLEFEAHRKRALKRQEEAVFEIHRELLKYKKNATT